MRIGLIGTKHVHAEGLAQNAIGLGAQLVGAYEEDPAAKSSWTLSPILELNDLLESVDAVIVAGTNAERVRGVMAAAERNLPILSEKPVGINTAELDTLAGVDPKLFMVALPFRFSLSVQRAKKAIKAGALGQPVAARGTNHGQFPGGWFGEKIHSGGGAMQDHIVHVSDLLCWLFNDQASHVYAVASERMHPELDVESCALASIDFESGLFASIDASWTRPDTFPTWGDAWLEIVGTEGQLLIDPMATRLEFFNDSAGKMQHVPYAKDDMTRNMVEAFIGFAKGEIDHSPVTLAEGLHASETVQAAYRSVASGQREPVRA